MSRCGHSRDLLSFPTRRSSDLGGRRAGRRDGIVLRRSGPELAHTDVAGSRRDRRGVFHRRGRLLRLLSRPQSVVARPRGSAALRMTRLEFPAAWQLLRRPQNRWFVVAGLGGLAALVALLAFHHGDAIQYLTAKVQQGVIRDAVDATGSVNAVITVQVGSQVSGTIAQLNADFNSRVHKGDVIALIDPSVLQGALHQATADLESAKAGVAVAEADLAKAKDRKSTRLNSSHRCISYAV